MNLTLRRQLDFRPSLSTNLNVSTTKNSRRLDHGNDYLPPLYNNLVFDNIAQITCRTKYDEIINLISKKSVMQ